MERLHLLVTETFLFWATENSCFELFGDGKCGPFFEPKSDVKIIFT